MNEQPKFQLNFCPVCGVALHEDLAESGESFYHCSACDLIYDADTAEPKGTWLLVSAGEEEAPIVQAKPCYCPICGKELEVDATIESRWLGEFTCCGACQLRYITTSDPDLGAALIMHAWPMRAQKRPTVQ